jgi:hypothetical protein
MAAQTKQPQSIFPDLPRQVPVIGESGDFTSLWSLGFSALFQALQDNWKNEGIIFPPLTAAQMTEIQNLYASYVGGSYNNLTRALPDISGQTVYDKTTQISNQFVIAQDGAGNVILAEWVPFSMMLTNSGDPNGHVAGVLNWLCYDIANKKLYACTTAGNAANAAWTPI